MTLMMIEEMVHAALIESAQDLPAPPWKEMGHGVWGTVYDLGDGSVLKLVRKRGGLGSAAGLIHRETSVLAALGGQRVGGFQLPALLGHGDLSLPANPFVAPLEGWLRLSRLNGKILSASVPTGPDARQRLGEQLGAAIADFHAATPALSDAGKIPTTDPIDRAIGLLATALPKPEDKLLCERLRVRWHKQERPAPVLLHGDINFSNVLVDDDGGFGLIDFAECGYGPAHADFRHLESRPEFRDAVFLGYRVASGAPIDIDTYYLAATVNALATLYFGGTVQPGVTANDPRVGMRLRGMVRHCADKAGLEE
ncbi:MAG: hypothetical protein COA62_14015 [Rhodobiaceae bacterium]|nr:MAG: hypothetical protein COA62_14015 [Rhodobiaceae bacterium]